MSYVSKIKQLYTEDLKGLITHVTGHQEGSADFKKCEDVSWSFILDHYYPAVHDIKVKRTLYEFVDKFKVHGFPQKAKNLEMLIDIYSELDYFKKYSGVGIQWGLVDFLIKLSFKPTNALEDDPPLNLAEIRGKKKEESFDWGTYLKEGWEKFVYPSEDEDSWTEEDEIPDHDHGPTEIKEPPRPVLRQPAEPSASDLRLASLRRAEAAAKWLEEHTQNMWWKNPAFREIPESTCPEANYCFTWEQMALRDGTAVNETRVLSEYKVMMELIYVLAAPSSCYFIKEISKDCFKPIPNISICSISPNLFSIVMEENFCVYLPYIKKLQAFGVEMETDFSPLIPCTFRAYGCSLKTIFCKYRKKLEDIESKITAQDDVTTIRYLLKEIVPWLKLIAYLYRVHEEAISQDYKEHDCRSNSLKLLSVLYNEVKHLTKWKIGDSSWQRNTILCIFIDVLEPFLNMLGCHMAGKHHEYSGSEFFLSELGTPLVNTELNGADEFWKPVLQSASAAVISCNFLKLLGKESSFFINNCSMDIMHVEIVKKLSKILQLPDIVRADIEDPVFVFKKKEEIFPPDIRQTLFHNGNFLDRVFREVITPRPKIIKSTVTDKLMESLQDIDLSSSPVHIYVTEAVQSVIEDYMEPRGFAADILLGQFQLLEHLHSLYTVVQLTSALSTILITESSMAVASVNLKNMKIKKCFDRFESCLLGILSPDYVKNFKFRIDTNLYEKKHVSLLEKPNYIELYYQANQEIRFIISNEIINGYTKLFRSLLKIRIALDSVKRLAMDFIEETDGNILRFRQLCSLRMWLIHTMSALNHYFSTYTDTEFQKKISDLCLKERNLSAIYHAHEEFIEKWQFHCFVSEGHPCLENMKEFISICNELIFYWKKEKENILADFHLEQIEQKYLDCIRKFVGNIQQFEERLVDRNDTFAFFYDEIMNNIPIPLHLSSSETD